VAQDDSDDDSVVGSELKKKVGVNEHLNAALASLENDGALYGNGSHNEVNVLEDTPAITQIPLTKDGGRPLSNHELMDGSAPLFGVDDSPLPVETDLGIHETRDEQLRSREQKKIQAIIENVCPQNILGSLACPNPAMDPDDTHTWNAMSSPRIVGIPSTSRKGATTSPAPSERTNRKTPSTDKASNKGKLDPSAHTRGMSPKSPFPFNSSSMVEYDPRSRFGWWNKNEHQQESETGEDVESSSAEELPVQLPPLEHAAFAPHVETGLEPKPETLHKQNLPLSRLNPATSMAQALPFLSDRPPSYRFLQIDTQAVTFSSLAGEIEPLFCSVAVYHVESVSQNVVDPSVAPKPDLSRCGKVTETLHFDVVADREVEQRCKEALFPYPSSEGEIDSQGTRCGVFPLPSNLSINNLYATILVKKVVSEGTDFEPYIRPGKNEDINRQDRKTLEAMRARAERASNQQGKFIMPFAFGVAPLLQVFGADVPQSPRSRAVQIPLFRFSSGQGERQIIDHIMVMLNPRADHSMSGVGGPAPILTNGGHAMLVMRNFGYLGLHSVVNSKSSLARDRLVDFTGESQLMRRNGDGTSDEERKKPQSARETDTVVVSEWDQEFVSEAALCGGRNRLDLDLKKDGGNVALSLSPLYAQELSPLPLNCVSNKIPSKSQRGGRAGSSAQDIEPYYHTSFCNQLLCHPRSLNNCPKGNIVVKVEVREMEWSNDYGAYFAHVPECGPCIHNPRRGPYLVSGVFTACSSRCVDPSFLEEVKIKLPLILEPGTDSQKQRSLSVFFTVFKLSFSTRKKWTRRLRGMKKIGQKVDEISGDLVGDSTVEDESSGSCHLVQLACGHLPISSGSAIIGNGNQDVKLSCIARYPRKELYESGRFKRTAYIVSEIADTGRGIFSADAPRADNEEATDSESAHSGHVLGDNLSSTSATDSMGRSDSIDERKRRQSRSKAVSETMSLEVKVSVQSSVHAQNSTLGDFFGQETSIAASLQNGQFSFASLNREALLAHLDSDTDTPMSQGTAYEMEKLLISTVDISKPSMCSISDVSRNLLRVTQQLWTIVIAGTAESGIRWANPKSVIPLRIHAFASLLQLLGSTTVFFAKRGLAELNGTDKWNLITLSRVLALLFDEGTIFGDHATEPISSTLFEDMYRTSTRPANLETSKGSLAEKKRRHVRSNFEFLNNSDKFFSDDKGERRAYGGSDILFSGPSHDDSSFQSGSGGASSPSSKVSKPSLTRSKTEGSTPSPTPKTFVDSVNDFKNALETGYREEIESDELLVNESSIAGTSDAAQAMMKAFSGPVVGRKRWMTAPAPNLATISEDAAGDATAFDKFEEQQTVGTLDSLDTELLLKPLKSKPKQMRVPNVKKAGKKADQDSDTTGDEEGEMGFGSPLEDIAASMSSVAVDAVLQEEASIDESKSNTIPSTEGGDTLPRTDDEIESAGISFLEAIERSFGLSGVNSGVPSGEEKRVGHAHHRKTRSHCSIDWTIPNDDLIVGSPRDTKKEASTTSDLDMSMQTLSSEKKICVRLPTFVDRILSLGDAGYDGTRWFPFAYEIVIMQWLALLQAQKSSSVDNTTDFQSEEGRFDRNGGLSDAASRTGGVIIACAPVLFEVIKQSLGWRVDSLFRQFKGENAFKNYPALVSLDDTLLSSLTEVIIQVTDACLDTRNFDSWDTQKTCNDVNDSIVLFLRDLFAFLDPECVYRLMRAYLLRLSRRDDNARNKDSKIGLWCAWEVTKLQMNAVSALLRFPDFIRVNSPQANSWGEWWTESFTSSGTVFYDNVLSRYSGLGNYVLEDGDEDEVDPSEGTDNMVPHWLAGFVIEICVLGIEHAEQTIQKRSAALLLELFWSNSQESLKDGTSAIVASMYITFLEKIISRTAYLASCFHAKSQVRQDVLRCVIFVLQCAPAGLLRSLWRTLCSRASGKGAQERFGGLGFIIFAETADDVYQENQRRHSRTAGDLRQENDVFEMFCLLNLCLSTLEYEGSDEQIDGELMLGDGPLAIWQKEYLVAKEEETMDMMRRRRLLEAFRKPSGENDEDTTNGYATSSSRKWHAHDGALVAIKTAMQIVRELRLVLEPSAAARSFFNPARQRRRYSTGSQIVDTSSLAFSYSDTVIFVRAAASVYLHSLALRQSDIVLVKTLHASVELVKIHGIKMFNEAVGETLQHWMRVVSYHCGSRRAEVRVPASDFLELILRSTWDTFGSFFRIRVPLLAVQTEVMERIVATAAARHYRDQRNIGAADIEFFSNGSAEASLAPLWRTLDRLHNQSASQNVAFKSALIRLAEKLKKLFRAYIAAHALSYLNRSKVAESPTRPDEDNGSRRNLEAETLIRANRTRLHRVINASAGYSKQFLGFYSTSVEHSNVAHHEAVEDAFLDAADVFSPTELPDHRVAWLRKLAEFHESRGRFAEEATCHYQIYLTYKKASGLHGSLWSSTPFLPWTDNTSEGIHLDGEGPTGADDASGFEGLPDMGFGKHMEKTNQFRRIFYRHENSIRNGADFGSGCSKFAFFGVALATEYHTVTPWIQLREMEANMLEEAEFAGDLFLSAGIVASSQYVWSLASQYYAEKFIYGKLAQVYERLAGAVVSHVPPVDSSMYQEVCVTEPIGRFYRVWFHGGAPDELMGAEFVYRTASTVTLDQFGNELRKVIRCIVPEKTPIHLVLDGRPEESNQQNYSGFSRMGSTLEPVRVKVTPLRPLMSKSTRVRGLPEWFDDYIDTAFGCKPGSTGSNRHVIHRSNSLYNDTQSSAVDPHHRDHARSFSASVFSSASTSTPRTRFTMVDKAGEKEGGLVGADKFSFIQPISKGRTFATRDWLKGSSSDYAEKTLRVTQLQVAQTFPACVSRQVVAHRVVYTQSPLEAAVDGICQWCAVLFRTAIATKGRAVLGIDTDPGIGFEAAKVVSDSIYSSRVKEIGLYLLQKNNNVAEEEDADVLQSFDRLGEDEVNRLQLKLARSLVVFLELIHLLVARNRDLLLAVIQERKGKAESASMHTSMHASVHSRNKSLSSREVPLSEPRPAKNLPRQNSMPMFQDALSSDGRSRDESGPRAHKQAHSTGSLSGGLADWEMSAHSVDADPLRTNKAMNIQSELQRAFLGLTKDLYPMIMGIMGSETPKWLKSACQESYMKGSAYRNTKIPIGEELGFDDVVYPHEGGLSSSRRSTRSTSVRSHDSDDGLGTGTAHRALRFPGSPGGSLETSSVMSRGSDGRSFRSRRSYDR